MYTDTFTDMYPEGIRVDLGLYHYANTCVWKSTFTHNCFVFCGETSLLDLLLLGVNTPLQRCGL